MAELVDALALGASLARGAGSSPVSRTSQVSVLNLTYYDECAIMKM